MNIRFGDFLLIVFGVILFRMIIKWFLKEGINNPELADKI